MIESTAANLVTDADFQLLQPVKDVELCQRNPLNSRDFCSLAHECRVEPAAAALAPGDGAELMPALAQKLADLILLLGRERSLPDAGRVGLGDPENVADGIW